VTAFSATAIRIAKRQLGR
jgi:hypothetical protein